MDHPPFDHNSASVPAPGGPPKANAVFQASAGNADSDHGSVAFSQPRNNEATRSLAEIAARDLDAALQLLAERAQYITDASGAAIALRRGEHNDMLCRASAGSNAPELGAILSMRYGLSGESIRSGQVQRCDDAQNDPRVNREACLQLGIASVIVMPILSGEQAFGVFELFSGKPFAFAERDVSTLQRLSAMVELAVKFAVTAQTDDAIEEPAEEVEDDPVRSDASVAAVERTASGLERAPSISSAPAQKQIPSPAQAPAQARTTATVGSGLGQMLASASNAAVPESPPPQKQIHSQETIQGKNISPKKDSAGAVQESQTSTAQAQTEAAQEAEQEKEKKPLFWTAPPTESSAAATSSASNSAPPTLRNLQKCQACGFPVSQGRLLCVECEEKKWRGQPLPRKSAVAIPERTPKPGAVDLKSATSSDDGKTADQKIEPSPNSTEKKSELPLVAAGASAKIQPSPTSRAEEEGSASGAVESSSMATIASAPTSAAPFLSSAVDSQSWLAANKYVVIALLIVAALVAGFVFLR